MKSTLRCIIPSGLRLVGLLALSCEIALADPITFRLVQTGWTGGGQVTGTFTGEDLNADGVLALDQPGEMRHYVVHLSSNALIPDFTHTMEGLKFFRYTLGTSGFPPSFPLFSDDGSFFYDADDKIIRRSGFGALFIQTTEAASVAPVPEPSALILVSSGLAALMYRRRGPSRHCRDKRRGSSYCT